MEALRATSDELRLFPIVTGNLTPYAGPQCFPHLQVPARRFAGDAKRGNTADVGADAPRKQLTGCWLQCDRCRKWRVVERTSLPALKPETYARRRDGCVDADWGRWLGEARPRYDAFLQRLSGQDDDFDVEDVNEVADVGGARPCAAGQVGDDEHEHAGASSEGSANTDAGTWAGGSDDECRNAKDEEVRVSAAWGRALARLRGRGGGVTMGERREQRRLAYKEQVKEQVKGGRGGGLVTRGDVVGGSIASKGACETRVLFTCDMLLREERAREGERATRSCEWFGMSCDDPDDFLTLTQRRSSMETI